MKKKNVLIIDDDKDLCKEIVDYLGGVEIAMQAVHSGLDGLKEIEQHNYDCILLDLKMEGMKGEELFEKIKGRVAKFHFAVIVLTGYGSIPTCVKMVKDGVFHFIEKHNLDYQLLFDAVKEAVENVERKRNI